MAAADEKIRIFGQVRGYDLKPITTIKVTVYNDIEELAHTFTGPDGRYSIQGPAGKVLTVRFDTHNSITNFDKWHPSVVANIEAKADISLDRFLMGVGFVDSETAAIDALAAYQFVLTWAHGHPDREYAESASRRLGMIKFTTRILVEVSHKLRERFLRLAQGHLEE
jgi:hypothetical protein